MSVLRTLLVYFADRHTAIIATIFTLFTLLIAKCGDIGSAEVQLRLNSNTQLNASASSEVSLSSPRFSLPSFTTTVAARATSVALVALTAADVEMLNGGPLPLAVEWTSEMLARMSRRWHRHYVVGDVNLVRVPLPFASTAVVERWLPYLESLCVDCYFLPVAAADERADVSPSPPPEGNGVDQLDLTHAFCSSSNALGEQEEELGAIKKTRLDVVLWNAVPGKKRRALHDVAAGCGVVAVLTPTALQSYSSTLVDVHEEHVHTNASLGDSTTFESAMAWAASSMDPPVPAPPSPTMENTSEARKQRAAEVYNFLVAGVMSPNARRLSQHPYFLLYVAWCTAARTYTFHAPQRADGWDGAAQPSVHVLCVRETEVIEVATLQRRFHRIREEVA